MMYYFDCMNYFVSGFYTDLTKNEALDMAQNYEAYLYKIENDKYTLLYNPFE